MSADPTTPTTDHRIIAAVNSYMVATYGTGLSDQKLRRVLEALRGSGYEVRQIAVSGE